MNFFFLGVPPARGGDVGVVREESMIPGAETFSEVT